MEIYNRKFTGPVELDLDVLPNTPAVYVISRKGGFDPQYIGFSSFLSTRLKNHAVLVKLDLGEHELYYSEFDEDDPSEIRDFEKKLILKYQPPFNKMYVTKNKLEEKSEKTKKLSNILAGAASSIALAALMFTTTGLIFTQDSSMSRSELSVKSAKLEKTIDTNYVLTKALMSEVNAFKTELSAISEVPEGALWAAESKKIDQRLSSLESKLNALENALTSNPVKALAVPILRKDLDNAQAVFKSEINQSRAEVNRLYSQNNWFIGLMITIAVSVLGMAISNSMNRKES